jgi:hypothetical protein
MGIKPRVLAVAWVSHILYCGRRSVWGSSIIIMGMPTPGLRSLGLGAVHRVAPCQRPTHLGLVPICHECAPGWGMRGLLGTNTR